ncbi:hypothetical protein C482_13825 [Natrialba chahannaoensis JCM 10990]|uniref:Uncharacterized protein n=1 Tax=Natrialba chahannaoensis JCM 10990 TaxID=1227492 RepID=M0AH34_9EURY|nr:hypothetical protein [Natrialba chahannaoensis]ELY97212.1 hypothetical protein C482_13825 [Natrialba chahannaoensis JCM 10990]
MDASAGSASSTIDSEPGHNVDDAANELAERIDSGDVTGADVRAAEAGTGRESTPEIDDVDLSLDDLETSSGDETGSNENSTATATTSANSLPDDAGPLAGAVDATESPVGARSGTANGTAGTDTESEMDSSAGMSTETGTSASASETVDGSESGGFLDRLKRFFSR